MYAPSQVKLLFICRGGVTKDERKIIKMAGGSKAFYKGGVGPLGCGFFIKRDSGRIIYDGQRRTFGGFQSNVILELDVANRTAVEVDSVNFSSKSLYVYAAEDFFYIVNLLEKEFYKYERLGPG